MLRNVANHLHSPLTLHRCVTYAGEEASFYPKPKSLLSLELSGGLSDEPLGKYAHLLSFVNSGHFGGVLPAPLGILPWCCDLSLSGEFSICSGGLLWVPDFSPLDLPESRTTRRSPTPPSSGTAAGLR